MRTCICTATLVFPRPVYSVSLKLSASLGDTFDNSFKFLKLISVLVHTTSVDSTSFGRRVDSQHRIV